jgi:hypothetical protein
VVTAGGEGGSGVKSKFQEFTEKKQVDISVTFKLLLDNPLDTLQRRQQFEIKGFQVSSLLLRRRNFNT